VLTSKQHNRVHAGIGGDIGPPGSSPNDPLFFPFHANVDRTWWLWQQQDPSKRNVDFEGDAVFGQPVSINDTLFFSDLYPDVTVRQVMTTNNDVLCYKYA
jgi:tyrosinase